MEERSNILMLLKELREEGMLPLKKLPLRLRFSKLVQPLKVAGMLLENRFLEISKATKLIKLPTCEGKGPLRRLSDRSRRIERVVMPRIY